MSFYFIYSHCRIVTKPCPTLATNGGTFMSVKIQLKKQWTLCEKCNIKKLMYEVRKVQRLFPSLFFLIFYLELGTRVRTTHGNKKRLFLLKKKKKLLYTKIFSFNLLYFNSFFYLKIFISVWQIYDYIFTLCNIYSIISTG